jgi:hypothetical protein
MLAFKKTARMLACHTQCQHTETVAALTVMNQMRKRHQKRVSFA